MYNADIKNLSLYTDDKWEFYEAQKDLKDVRSLIEIGCGEGAFLKIVQHNVSCIVGVEYNEQAIKASRKNGFSIYTSDEYDAIPKNYFDAVVVFHVLEHVADPVNFIKNLTTLITNNGKIYLSVPNQDGPIKFINPCIHNMPPHHATRWHTKTFEILAEQLNLFVEKIRYEPLATRDHYYYTYYWINSKIKNTKMRYLINKITSCFFKILIKLHIHQFKWLQGQSLYIILKKNVEA